MTAREWVERTFRVVGNLFVASERGDFRRFFLPSVNPDEMPFEPVSADIDLFCAWFGSAIESALSSGGSIYAALTDGTVQPRGWRPYFELWKAKGIIN